VRAALSELVLLLVGHLPSAAERVSEKAQRDGERIKLMLRFIQQNIDGELTVAEIAARAAISESECLRCFHDTIGIAPKQYVKRYRIQKAAELLTSTDGKIADIGARCGFLDTSYFTRAFHEVKGMTPGEFRQSYNGKWRVENGE
jgi:AraC-like DNA-binding protein